MRRLLQAFGVGLIILTLAVVSLPLWLGPVLREVGARTGAIFERYERLGYARFAVHGVRYERPGVEVWVERLEAPAPLVWGWRHWRGRQGALIAGRWEADITPVAAAPSTAAEPVSGGWIPLQARLSGVMDTVARWLPSAELAAGEARIAGRAFRVGPAVWRDRTLQVSSVSHRGRAAELNLAWPAGDDGWTLLVSAQEPEARGELRGQGGLMTGVLTLWGQEAHGEAKFAPTGWLPAEAGFAATDWRIDGHRLGLGAAYGLVTGRAGALWREGRLSVDLAAQGEPAQEREAPPLTVDLRGSGTAGAFSLEVLNVRIPGIHAELSAPLVINPADGLAVEPSQFVLNADLADLPWGAWRGTVQGELVVAPAADSRWPEVTGELEAADIGHDVVAVARARVGARLVWPRLSIGEAWLETDGSGRLELTGAWDFATRELVEGAVSGVLRREAVAPWLPDGVAFEQLELEASASGVWPEMTHRGHLDVTELQLPPLKAMYAGGSWNGSGPSVERMDFVFQAGTSALSLRGAVDAEQARVDLATWTAGEREIFRLQSPVTFGWTPPRRIDGLKLEGEDASLSLSLQWDEGRQATVAARQFQSAWLEDWIDLPGPAWTVHSLEVEGSWADGPFDFKSAATLEIALGQERRATVAFSAEGGADGLHLAELRASEDARPIVSAEGQLPISLWPTQAPFLRIERDAPLTLSVSSEPNPGFWTQVAELTRVQLTDPLLRANLTGTWEQPEGDVTLTATRVALAKGPTGRAFPELTALRAQVVGDGEGIELQEFRLAVAGQEVRAQGRLPMGPAQWEEARADPLAFLEKGADLRIEIPDADLGTLARYVPEYLAPAGRLQVDLTVRPGGDLEGFLKITDAASRPLGPLGVLQEIGADIRLAGRQVELRSVTARAGGQPVTLAGTIELPRGERMPRLALTLTGEDLPFVRQAGLLVRGDLDLRLSTLEDGRTRISGTTRLRDSLFLSDIRAFIPRGGRSAAPTRRPPYFSVDVAPMRDWLLDVELTGERFLRLRTPVFNGEASARFRLGGTLGDPRAVGEATINEGRVLLPFASFRVQQGVVRLTEADPYEPALMITGSTRRFGYDVRMELSGTASNPSLVFTSSPPLESEQVLLMVMAGEAPGGEIAYSGNQRAVRLGTYLGQSLINRLGGDPARAERFSLTTGERISRQGRETYGFSYELDSRWSLVGEYDEFDDYNVGIKRRIFAREEKKEDDETP